MSNQHRVWFILLYPDSTSYDCEAILKEAEHFKEYAYILHDKDVLPTGEVKKPHIHLALRTAPCSIETILNHFPGLDAQFIEYKHKWTWVIQYLVHFGHISKYQYEHEDVITNIEDIEKFWRPETEHALVLQMIHLRIKGATWYEILNYANEHNAYDVFRRNQGVISVVADDTINEHEKHGYIPRSPSGLPIEIKK